MARLSAGEQRYAHDTFVALGRHLKAAVLDQLPANYQALVRRRR